MSDHYYCKNKQLGIVMDELLSLLLILVSYHSQSLSHPKSYYELSVIVEEWMSVKASKEFTSETVPRLGVRRDCWQPQEEGFCVRPPWATWTQSLCENGAAVDGGRSLAIPRGCRALHTGDTPWLRAADMCPVSCCLASHLPPAQLL